MFTRREQRRLVRWLAAAIIPAVVAGFLFLRAGDEPGGVTDGAVSATASASARPTQTVKPTATSNALPGGLQCTDLAARGMSYAQAVDYWTRQGAPARMDADGNGVPCETVYPTHDVLAYWGKGGGPLGTARVLAEQALARCGYVPTMKTSVGAVTAEGYYPVQTAVDTGGQAVDVTFRVWVETAQVIPGDQTSSEVLACRG